MRERTPWFPAYVAASACLLASNLLTWDKATQAAANKSVALAPAIRQISDLTVRSTLVLSPFLSPLTTAFLIALLLALTSTVIGVKTRFAKLYALAMWAVLPLLALGNLVRSALWMALPNTDPSQIMLGPAVWLSDNSWLYRVASSLDIFTLWFIALLVTGYALLHKLPLRRAVPVGAVFYALVLAAQFVR